jgi:hypothetical protein
MIPNHPSDNSKNIKFNGQVQEAISLKTGQEGASAS